MPVLCKVIRGDFIESIHRAYAVVVDGNKEIIFRTGDPNYFTCIRSSLKPFQALAGVRTGAVDEARFSLKELALMCASHNGEDIHVKTARGMMDKLGYDLSAYECGVHSPYDKSSRLDIIKNNSEFLPLHNNCSGKHAGMLCLAKYLGVSHKGYVEPEHPVQKQIIATVNDLTGMVAQSTAIDGCSAPTPFMTLTKIALLFQKLAADQDRDLSRIYNAMTANPYLIAGRNRFDTDFITALNGRAVCKVGGEAIRGFGLRGEEGRVLGVAVKILDGNQRVSGPAALVVLNHLGLLTKEELIHLEKYREPVLKNHRGITIGKIIAELDG